MKDRLMNWLRCPECHNEFELKSFTDENGPTGTEVKEGLLMCTCGQVYPIIGGIPRLLPADLMPELVDRYPAFFSEYKGSVPLARRGRGARERSGRLKTKTIKSFGYEWTRFSDYDAANFLELIYPVEPEFFREKLGLDAGCGAGRHARQAVSYGAEMIGMDISWAVEAAYANTAHLATAHIIQADIFKPPFKPKSVDFAYSLGVLMCTPDPPRAFAALVPVLKSGAPLMVWIYSNTRRVVLFCLAMARTVTTRLPNPLINLLSFASAVIDYGLFVGPYKALRKVPVARAILERITPPRIKGYSKYGFRVNYTDWFDRYSYPVVYYYSRDDIDEWYRKCGLQEISVTPTGLHAWRGFGKAKCLKPAVGGRWMMDSLQKNVAGQ